MGHFRATLSALAAVALLTACDTPQTLVLIQNAYPRGSGLVVYRAFWQAVLFKTPVPPGTTSTPQGTIAASANTAYVLLAPGWDPASMTTPSSFIVLQSRAGFALELGDGLTIPVDDTTFAGNCSAGSFLTQEQADFITQRVFAAQFVSAQYDAATCATTLAGDSGP